MAILNYTTKIEATTTVGLIQSILARAGAHQVSVHYGTGGGVPTGVSFSVPVGPQHQLVFFQLPCNWEGVLKALRKSGAEKKYLTEAQAVRVAWRIIKDWCEAQLAIIEAGQAQLAEVFLPYAVTKEGPTLYRAIEAGNVPPLLLS